MSINHLFQVVLLAMKDMNVAKLTADDLPLFNGITSDLFPQVETPVLEYEELTAGIEHEFNKANLQVCLTFFIQQNKIEVWLQENTVGITRVLH